MTPLITRAGKKLLKTTREFSSSKSSFGVAEVTGAGVTDRRALMYNPPRFRPGSSLVGKVGQGLSVDTMLSFCSPTRLTRLAKVIGLVTCLSIGSAAYGLSPAKIREILNHPRDFEGKDVRVRGTVTNAVSLLLIKYYEVQDETGSIKVLTERLLPGRGEKLTVTGRMAVVELGPERWVVLRETQSDSGTASTKEGPLYFLE